MSSTQLPLLANQLHEFKPSRKQSILTNYDPSAYPPDLEIARNHGQSQRIGSYIPVKQDVQRCLCCLEPIHKHPLPLQTELHQLLHLGPAYPLYFYFIKQCIVLLLINIIICSIPALIINLTQGNMCKELDGLVYNFYSTICKSSVINIMNVKEIDMLAVQAVLNFLCIVVNCMAIGVMEVDMQRKWSEWEAEYVMPGAGEYSLMVKGVPKDVTLLEIQKFLEQKLLLGGAPDTSIIKIYLIYNLKIYNSLYTRKRELVQRMAELQHDHASYKERIQQLDQGEQRNEAIRKVQDVLDEINEIENKQEMVQIEINTYEESFIALAKSMREGSQVEVEGHGLRFSGKCIVTLNHKKSRDVLVGGNANIYCLQRLGYYLGELMGGRKGTLLITEAPEPSDIVFSKIGSEKMAMWKDWAWVTFILVFLILLDFVLLTLSKKFVKEEKAINKENIIFSILNSQLIALFNSIVSKVIRYFENKTHMHSTLSGYYYSVTSKLVVLFLINMLITTFFSNLVTFYLINEKSRTFDKFPLNFEDYLFDVFFLLITNPFVSVFLIFFDHRQGYKFYKRFRIERGLPVTQAEANSDYENMQMDLSNKYGNIYRFVLFSAGICFIYPPAMLVCLLSVLTFYWLDKYLLLRRYVIPHKLPIRLTFQMQKIMWMLPLLLSITNLTIMYVPIRDGQAFEHGEYSKFFYYLAWGAVLFTIIIYAGGCNWIVSGLKAFGVCKGGVQAERPNYVDVEKDMEEDYWHHYPYFKVHQKQKKMVKETSSLQSDLQSSLSEASSPRKQKILEMRRNMGLSIFSVIKAHLHHDRYAPIV